jgi:hypothetical protein
MDVMVSASSTIGSCKSISMGMVSIFDLNTIVLEQIWQQILTSAIGLFILEFLVNNVYIK